MKLSKLFFVFLLSAAFVLPACGNESSDNKDADNKKGDQVDKAPTANQPGKADNAGTPDNSGTPDNTAKTGNTGASDNAGTTDDAAPTADFLPKIDMENLDTEEKILAAMEQVVNAGLEDDKRKAEDPEYSGYYVEITTMFTNVLHKGTQFMYTFDKAQDALVFKKRLDAIKDRRYQDQ
ncbi:MAG: hypothetical protein AAF570_22240 [Bacteroidota bacterium]